MDEIRVRGKLMTGEELLAELFTDAARPSMRWLRRQIRARNIPFVRLGRFIVFDIELVRTSLTNRNLVGGKFLQSPGSTWNERWRNVG